MLARRASCAHPHRTPFDRDSCNHLDGDNFALLAGAMHPLWGPSSLAQEAVVVHGIRGVTNLKLALSITLKGGQVGRTFAQP